MKIGIFKTNRSKADNMISAEKKERLQAAGWKIGTAKYFLQLSNEAAKLVEIKLALVTAVKKSRIKNKLSQIDLAQRMKSTQSRIAKIESADLSVSLNLIVRTLIANGATSRDIRAAFALDLELAA